MIKVQYTKSAFADLKAIEEYISLNSVYYAKSFLRDIRKRILILQTHPELGRLVYPERFTLLRQILFKSYRIIYTYENSKITIHTVHHQSRLLDGMEVLKPFEI